MLTVVGAQKYHFSWICGATDNNFLRLSVAIVVVVSVVGVSGATVVTTVSVSVEVVPAVVVP